MAAVGCICFFVLVTFGCSNLHPCLGCSALLGVLVPKRQVFVLETHWILRSGASRDIRHCTIRTMLFLSKLGMGVWSAMSADTTFDPMRSHFNLTCHPSHLQMQGLLLLITSQQTQVACRGMRQRYSCRPLTDGSRRSMHQVAVEPILIMESTQMGASSIRSTACGMLLFDRPARAGEPGNGREGARLNPLSQPTRMSRL